MFGIGIIRKERNDFFVRTNKSSVKVSTRPPLKKQLKLNSKVFLQDENVGHVE